MMRSISWSTPGPIMIAPVMRSGMSIMAMIIVVMVITMAVSKVIAITPIPGTARKHQANQNQAPEENQFIIHIIITPFP